MSTNERVMLLIDADNVSVDIMDQAVRLVHQQHGGLHVRRAYCTAESAVKHQAVFKRLSIKPMVNLAAGKNSTDIALAVDAIDLVLAERPDVVVIASSDSDFAPLVQRLREKGCVVRGIGQQGKTGAETVEVYDDFTVLEHRGAASDGPARKRAPARAGAAAKKARAAPAASEPAAKQAARKVAKKSGRVAVDAASDAAARKATTKSGARRASPATAATAATAADADGAAGRPAAAADEGAPAPATPAQATRTPATRTPAARKRAKAQPADLSPAPSPAPAVAEPAAKAPRKRAARSAPQAADVPQAPAVQPGRQAGPGPANPNPAPSPKPSPQGALPRPDIDAVLACLPELATGQALAINVAVQRLREARLLGRNTPSTRFFAALSERLELRPAGHPSQVLLRR